MKRNNTITNLLFRLFSVFFTCLFPISSLLIAQQSNWQTHYERSGKLATPRYDATMAFVDSLRQHSPLIHTGVFGQSPQQRDLIYAVIDKEGLDKPEAIHASGRLLLMVQAGIHPGESEGKDAMLLMLRDMLVHRKHLHLLDKVSILFIPIFNVDGHERFGPHGRINQNGPEEMGWRTTAQNLNLNRDFLKADSPEMQAWLGLFNQWNPHFFIDTHTTDGADYQYHLTYALETGGIMTDALSRWQEEVYLPFVEQKMEKAGFLIYPYVTFRNWHDPRSGLVSGVAAPMFSQGYTALRNRPGLLVETHMLKPYQPRVESTYAIILSTLELLNNEGTKLSKLIADADQYVASKAFRTKPFPLRFSLNMTDSTMVTFKGVEYSVSKSELTGGDWFVYQTGKPEVFTLPMFTKSKVSESVMLPDAYVVPVQWTEAINRLAMHGVRMFALPESRMLQAEVDSFILVEWHPRPYEGRHRISKMEFERARRKVELPAGSMVVPMDQPLAPVIAQLLEPRGNGSLLEWGFFDAIFEQKEYAESYVMEPLARAMLDSLPELATAYEARKAADPAFANSPWAQLNWFYSHTPWWDDRYMIYPVVRLDSLPHLHQSTK
ncbi:MAG: M14 family metallopeptidase [Bacteroidales bacterium]|nr:M14 family metallopeptidase [Bacteroidales bacterium]